MKNRISYLVVVLFWCIVMVLISSCSSYKTHYQKQKRDYSQCWCIDPWDGGGEWCCNGKAPNYMAPYRHNRN